MMVSGSSPHSRGTLSTEYANFRKLRFIPALAGNIRSGWSFTPNQAVHPRTRGEHAINVPPIDQKYGSSPHSRGTSFTFTLHFSESRFIPALAGNIQRGLPGHRFTYGSSPHSRGTCQIITVRSPSSRFIPALAGNIGAGPGVSGQIAVHPRTRGEHKKKTDIGTVKPGSSPHSRGTCNAAGGMFNKVRFIPALAGNINVDTKERIHIPVHPRTRGEHV